MGCLFLVLAALWWAARWIFLAFLVALVVVLIVIAIKKDYEADHAFDYPGEGEPGTIIVTVMDLSQNAVPGVPITIEKADPDHSGVLYTNERGQVVLGELDPDSYTVSQYPPGNCDVFYGKARTVAVRGATPIEVVFKNHCPGPPIVVPGPVIQEPPIIVPGPVIQEPPVVVPGPVIVEPPVVVPAPKEECSDCGGCSSCGSDHSRDPPTQAPAPQNPPGF